MPYDFKVVELDPAQSVERDGYLIAAVPVSHRAPNATVINAADGSIAGTVDLGGAPEQAASDGKGHLYVDIEDKDNVAAIDTKTMKVTAHYDLGGGKTPAGLGFDVKNLEAFVKKLEANGVKVERPYTKNAQTGAALAFVSDPWGTLIELNERPNPL